MGRIVAVCLSAAKGTPKTPVAEATLATGHGIVGDAHAGDRDRQVSILPLERIEEFRQRGATVGPGDFGENLVVAGLDLKTLRVGDKLRCGEAVLEIRQLGKECRERCRIGKAMGDCIMPKHGAFARVVRGGIIRAGDEMRFGVRMHDIAVLTVSDKGSRGERVDASGDAIARLVEAHGYAVVSRSIVPDEMNAIVDALGRLCGRGDVALILTTGGTGFSPRDITPEATLAVAERLCPGIPEAMRAASLAKTKRAMLSRAIAGIRGRTLIVNLPGSPKAARECLESVIDELGHGLDILREKAGECGMDTES